MKLTANLGIKIIAKIQQKDKYPDSLPTKIGHQMIDPALENPLQTWHQRH